MSKQKENFFKTFRSAVYAIFDIERMNQQDLADRMGANKGNLSTYINNDDQRSAKKHGLIEKELGYKITKKSQGWTFQKIKQKENLDRLFSELKKRKADDSIKELFEDDPDKALQVGIKLIQLYPELVSMKDRE